MTLTSLKQQIQEDMKSAMRSQAKQRLGTIRLILAAIKQIEVDERIEVDDARTLTILAKMVKQRQESLEQYVAANREDLAEQERFEIAVIQHYLPEPLTEAELEQLIDAAIASVDNVNMQAMGKVMASLKPQIQGRADASLVSAKVKQRLSTAN